MSNASKGLFSSVKIGQIGTASNRLALAPMTRARATNDGLVGQHHVEYYTQRSNAGLVITEGTHMSPTGVGWWCAPNIFTETHANAWKPVTKAVHDSKSLIVCQLWHTGRASHSDMQPNKQKPVAASAIPIPSPDGKGAHVPGHLYKPYETPRALETNEIPRLIQDYVHAAKLAINTAGFDGVEVHSANGYLLDGFLQSKTNLRTDQYGGSIENRVRLTDELLSALCKEIGPGKIGIRLSPNGMFNDMGSKDNIETFSKALEVISKHKIAYIHLMDGLAFGFHKLTEPFTLEMTKKIITKVQGDNTETMLMGNCGYGKQSAEKAIEQGFGDMISIGRPWMANPDLVHRYRNNLPLTNVKTIDHWYGPEAKDPRKGYTDWPAASSK